MFSRQITCVVWPGKGQCANLTWSCPFLCPVGGGGRAGNKFALAETLAESMDKTHKAG